MRLRERILILLFLAFCGYLGLELVIHFTVVKPKLEQLEHTIARQQLQRCEKALSGQTRKLQTAGDEFCQSSQLRTVLQQKVLPDDFSKTADFMGVVDKSGKWSFFAGSKTLAKAPDANAMLDKVRSWKDPIVVAEPPQYSQKGIMSLNGQLLLVSSHPCTLSSGGELPNSMTVIFGRFLTDELVRDMRAQIYTDFSCKPYASMSPVLSTETDYKLDPQDGIYSRKMGSDVLQCYKLMMDMSDKPVLALQTEVVRDILIESQHILYLAGYIRLATVFPAIAILTVIFQMIVVRPVVQLIRNITAIAKGQFVRSQRPLKRRDEIGILAYEFDRMMERLDVVQKKLVEKSYVSGMAEMASGVLHNARNALSPLVSGMERMGEKITTIDAEQAQRAITEIQQDNVDPKRKADLQRFLILSLEEQLKCLSQTKENLGALAKQIYQVEEMLNGQKFFSGAAKPLESVTLEELIEEAAVLIPAGLRSEIHVIIDKTIKELRPLRVHRVVFMQVLENLLVNGAESLVKAKPLYPKILVKAAVELVENIEMLHLRIEDNGTGIPEDLMKRLFERGVSSKPEGMTGIGLHWCANTIAAMRGRIWAESEGINRGACFHILLPVSQDKETLTISEEKEADYES